MLQFLVHSWPLSRWNLCSRDVSHVHSTSSHMWSWFILTVFQSTVGWAAALHHLNVLHDALAFSTFYTHLFYCNKHPVSQFYRVPLYLVWSPGKGRDCCLCFCYCFVVVNCLSVMSWTPLLLLSSKMLNNFWQLLIFSGIINAGGLGLERRMSPLLMNAKRGQPG